MTEILFYHLKGQTPEQVLPTLLQKSLDRGWRVVVQASSEERVEALDAHFGRGATICFFRTAPGAMPRPPQQPIVLTVSDHNPNGASRSLPGRGCA